jgi:hypothetical protein
MVLLVGSAVCFSRFLNYAFDSRLEKRQTNTHSTWRSRYAQRPPTNEETDSLWRPPGNERVLWLVSYTGKANGEGLVLRKFPPD